MDFENDDELLDWNMEIDDNFEEALNDDDQTEDLKRNSKRQRRNKSKNARSPDTWVRFSQEYEEPPKMAVTEKRWGGDGDSSTSQHEDTVVQTTNELQTKAPDTPNQTVLTTFETSNPHQRPNTFTNYLPSYNDDGAAKFEILNDDDAEITSYDISPVEFRGTLKTGNPQYKSEATCCCTMLRYLTVILLAFAVGLLIGYAAFWHRYRSEGLPNVNVNIGGDTTLAPTTRLILNSTIDTNSTGMLNDTNLQPNFPSNSAQIF